MDDETRSSDTHDVIGLPDLAAGGFSSWLSRTRNAQREKGTAGVPCGECIACCTSSYFIDVAPGESQTLARIPKELLFPAPGLPRGNVLLGYDESGRCPMLLDRACSIYEHRPQTCRSYDCRVFPAAGIEAGGRDKELIKRRVRRWRFSYPTEADRGEHLAVQAAATFLRRHADCFPDGFVPGNPAPLAVLAVKVYGVFAADACGSGGPARARVDLDVAAAVVAELERFEAARPR